MSTVLSSTHCRRCCAVILLICGLALLAAAESKAADNADVWELAKEQSSTHRFSTLFTAQDVRQYLGSEEGRQEAIAWCKRTGVTKVYLEEFRDGYRAERSTLETAKKQFHDAGFLVSGCVTTTRVGKPSTGWKEVACCYTDQPTQEKLQSIFEYAASLFDEIMIDDFWFTDCACDQCDAARRAKTVVIGEHHYPVSGDAWEDYRCELMVRLSRDRLLGPAKKINPNVRLIIKYPQWYDNFHERGYEVVRETADFDRIWVGTETRDYNDPHWGGTVQYEGYFIMRWLGGIGGQKCGGGWFDSLGTTERTYVEQARQTVLGGASESMLFCYGSLQHGSGPGDIEVLRAEVPALLGLARQIGRQSIIGVAAYKPPSSHPGKEARVFDFLGMMGVPLVPCHQFPANAPAAFFSVHSLKDPELASKLATFIKTGRPVLLTDGLAKSLSDRIKLDAANVHVLPVNGSLKSLLELGPKELDGVRAPLLRPFHTTFHAPNRVALYLFHDTSWVVENFNDREVTVELNGKPLVLPARSFRQAWK
jgi:hypothetical protein